MGYILNQGGGDWTLLEIVRQTGRKPFSAAWEGADVKDRVMIYRESRLLAGAGVPAAEGRVRPNYDRWSLNCPGDSKKSTFYVLKARPSGWRLYFAADEKSRTILFLWAVNKKCDPRDRSDFPKLCGLYAEYTSRSATTALFRVPNP